MNDWTNTDKEAAEADAEAEQYARNLAKREPDAFGMGVDDDGY